MDINEATTGKTILIDNVFKNEDYLKQIDGLLKFSVEPNANNMILYIQNEPISIPFPTSHANYMVESITLGNFVTFRIDGNNIKAVFAIGILYKNLVTPQYEIGDGMGLFLVCDVAYHNGKFTLVDPTPSITDDPFYENIYKNRPAL